MLRKERVRLDRFGASDAEALLRVAREQTGEERPGVGRDLVAEPQRIGQDLRRRGFDRTVSLPGRPNRRKTRPWDPPSDTSRSCSPSRRAADRTASHTRGRRESTSRPAGGAGQVPVSRPRVRSAHRLLIAVTEQELRREVLGRTAEGCGPGSVSHPGRPKPDEDRSTHCWSFRPRPC